MLKSSFIYLLKAPWDIALNQSDINKVHFRFEKDELIISQTNKRLYIKLNKKNGPNYKKLCK